jgi:glutathione S-transferase
LHKILSYNADYEYGQLPVLEVGDKKLAQSNAIARYLARKFKLTGADEWEAAKIDELVDVLGDLRMEWRKFFMEKDEEAKATLKNEFLEIQVPRYFSKLDSIKEKNGGKFLVGENVSWADLMFAHYLEFFEATVDAGMLDKYPNLKALKQNVFEIPQVKAWIEKRPQTSH